MSSVLDKAPPKNEDAGLESIVAACPLSDEARKWIEPQQTPNGFLGQLIQQQLYIDAIRFTAYKLPKRNAVWWATMCLWDNERPRPDQATDDAFAAVVRWVQTPNDTNRRAAEAAGRQAGVNSPIGILAMAVFCSDGSISLPECPEVKPDANATAQQVAAAVVLAAKKTPRGSTTAIDAQRRFLVLAAGVEEDKLGWDDSGLATST